jgi:hypothetical protein
MPRRKLNSGASDASKPRFKKQWHGASPTTAMTHIAIAQALNGKVVDWMEHVSDEQYSA